MPVNGVIKCPIVFEAADMSQIILLFRGERQSLEQQYGVLRPKMSQIWSSHLRLITDPVEHVDDLCHLFLGQIRWIKSLDTSTELAKVLWIGRRGQREGSICVVKSGSHTIWRYKLDAS